eukprot:scaffold8021_cov79-Skeletonema_marinoi.AAC.13
MTRTWDVRHGKKQPPFVLPQNLLPNGPGRTTSHPQLACRMRTDGDYISTLHNLGADDGCYCKRECGSVYNAISVEEELEGFVIIDDGCNCKQEDAFPTCDCVRETLKMLLSAVDNSSISVTVQLSLASLARVQSQVKPSQAKPRGHNSQALLLLSKLFPSLIDDVIAA